ncbi:hypothetical protein BC937DRAFT_92955 [Endogone sp. FLAS-F59071]|nr:hypothetical protein BC937DRAFT_92955 [Endogone sp. FLAS-F59071]|eukprot:RUS21344.1 hypothetical protein BC937DRAFT_92955 [Endogone sp. FLAS-F59071]
MSANSVKNSNGLSWGVISEFWKSACLSLMMPQSRQTRQFLFPFIFFQDDQPQMNRSDPYPTPQSFYSTPSRSNLHSRPYRKPTTPSASASASASASSASASIPTPSRPLSPFTLALTNFVGSRPLQPFLPSKSTTYAFPPAPVDRHLLRAATDDDSRTLRNPFALERWATAFGVRVVDPAPWSLLDRACERAVQEKESVEDGQGGKRSVEVRRARRLETYKELREAQNKRYARECVAAGISHLTCSRFTEALDSFRRAMDMDARYAEAWFYRGVLHASQKRWEEAVDDLRRALKLDPRHPHTKEYLVKAGQRKTVEVSMRLS